MAANPEGQNIEVNAESLKKVIEQLSDAHFLQLVHGTGIKNLVPEGVSRTEKALVIKQWFGYQLATTQQAFLGQLNDVRHSTECDFGVPDNFMPLVALSIVAVVLMAAAAIWCLLYLTGSS